MRRSQRKQAARQNALKPDEINYRIEGAENPETIILIHGLGSRLETWTDTVAVLKKKYRVITYDQRGHGQSVARGEDYSTYQMSEDLKSLADHLHLRKFHIIGHSLGARTAMRFADLHPEMVRSMILEDMDMQKRQDDSPEKTAKHLKYGRALAKMKSYYPSINAAIEELKILFDGSAERARRYIYRMGRIEDDAERDDTYSGPVWFSRPEVIAYFGFQGNTDDFGSVVQRLRMPKLFLRANPEWSPFFDDAGVAHLRQNATNYVIVPMMEADHTIHQPRTFPEFIDQVGRFLKGVNGFDTNREAPPRG